MPQRRWSGQLPQAAHSQPGGRSRDASLRADPLQLLPFQSCFPLHLAGTGAIRRPRTPRRARRPRRPKKDADESAPLTAMANSRPTQSAFRIESSTGPRSSSYLCFVGDFRSGLVAWRYAGAALRLPESFYSIGGLERLRTLQLLSCWSPTRVRRQMGYFGP
jgi:hypothetical protein